MTKQKSNIGKEDNGSKEDCVKINMHSKYYSTQKALLKFSFVDYVTIQFVIQIFSHIHVCIPYMIILDKLWDGKPAHD